MIHLKTKRLSLITSLLFTHHSFAYILEKSNFNSVINPQSEQIINSKVKETSLKIGGIVQWDLN